MLDDDAPQEFDSAKVDKIIKYKLRKDGSKCPHTSNSLSPQKKPAASAAANKPNVCFFGVPNTDYVQVDVRQGELILVEVEFKNSLPTNKSFTVEVQPKDAFL